MEVLQLHILTLLSDRDSTTLIRYSVCQWMRCQGETTNSLVTNSAFKKWETCGGFRWCTVQNPMFLHVEEEYFWELRSFRETWRITLKYVVFAFYISWCHLNVFFSKFLHVTHFTKVSLVTSPICMEIMSITSKISMLSNHWGFSVAKWTLEVTVSPWQNGENSLSLKSTLLDMVGYSRCTCVSGGWFSRRRIFPYLPHHKHGKYLVNTVRLGVFDEPLMEMHLACTYDISRIPGVIYTKQIS